MTNIATLLILIAVLSVGAYILKSIILALLPKHMDIKKYFNNSLWLILLLLGFRVFQPMVELSDSLAAIIDKTWQIAIILTLTYFLIRVVNFSNTIIKKNLQQTKFITQLEFAERLIVAFLVVIGFCLILLSFDGARRIGTSIIASAGLAGISIGFAAQKTLSNLIAGFQIAITQPFKLNDVIIVDGICGCVEEITLTYVVIKIIHDDKRLIVPINYLLERPFQNCTRSAVHDFHN